MFRLSQKADYGLILLSFIARIHPRGEAKAISGLHPGGVNQAGYVSISSIASKHKISTKFLSQIAQELKRAGILSSREGISGGYTLAKSADEIKILDVLRILEGDLIEGKCFEEGHECTCGAGEMWQQMKKQMEATLGHKTVADLVTR